MGKRRSVVDWQGEAERLREALIRIEALANAADEALADLPYVRRAGERRGVQRVAVLVEATATAAKGALGTKSA